MNCPRCALPIIERAAYKRGSIYEYEHLHSHLILCDDQQPLKPVAAPGDVREGELPEKLVPWHEIQSDMFADDLHYLEQAKGFLANSERMDNAPLPYMVAAAFKVSAQLRTALQQVAEKELEIAELKRKVNANG